MKRKEMRGIITSLITGFIGLTYGGISSVLHNRRHKALHKEVKTMETKSNIQHNKLIHLENSMVMYGVCSAEMLKNLINMVHGMCNTKTLHEKLFTGQLTAAYRWYINSHGNQGVQHYAIDSLLYLRMIKDNYVQMYNEFIKQLHIYAEAIRILVKGYLPILLITPLKLKEIFDAVKTTIRKMNPHYDIIKKRLHLYNVMKLFTFGIDRNKNLIIQFPVFIQPYTQQPLVLYQIETVPVPIIDLNTQADSYMN